MSAADALTRPILVLGVPRSGTTLVRTLLDSHPHIACGPETPWLAPHQPRSLLSLTAFLVDDPLGYCRSFGVEPEVVRAATRAFVETLLGAYAARRGKRRWAEKTPNDILYLGPILDLLPDAQVVFITRDGLDVAASTAIVSTHRKGVDSWNERLMWLAPELAVENNLFHAALRCRHWNSLVERSLPGREVFRLRYEDLVSDPGPVLDRLFSFLGEEPDRTVLDYARRPHDFPSWEWGSTDVQQFRTVTSARAGRAARELSPEDQALLRPVVGGPGAARPGRLDAPAVLALAAGYLASFARSLGLPAVPGGAAEEAQSLAATRLIGAGGWEGRRAVAHAGSGPVLPLLLGLLGASVDVVGSPAGEPEPAWMQHARALGVAVAWRPGPAGPPSPGPLPDAVVDATWGVSFR